MTSTKGRIIRWLGDWLTKEVRVEEKADLGPSFVRIALRGDALRGGDWRAGDKVQLLLPSDDVRTYTPVRTGEDEITLCGWRLAGGPGARWFAEVEVGASVRLVGPQRSLRLGDRPVVLVGDETSIAVAASSGPALAGVVLVAAEPDAVHIAAEGMGLGAVEVVPRDDPSGLARALRDARARAPEAAFAVTGGAALVVAARRTLRERGLGDVRVKTYWASGRPGLD